MKALKQENVGENELRVIRELITMEPILSVAKRFASYETLGALFRDTGADVLELTLNERLWVYICQVVSELAELFGLDAENVMSKLIAENQAFTKVINLKSLLQALFQSNG